MPTRLLSCKQREIKYNDDGSLKRYSKKKADSHHYTRWRSDPNAPETTTETIEVKGTSALEKANAQFSALHKQEVAVKKEMQEIINTANKPIKHTAGYSSTMPTFSSSTPKPTPKNTSQKEKELKEKKIRISIEEKPEAQQAKTAIEELQRQLQDAQKEFDNVTTIEAKVKANAKVAAISCL